MNTTSLRCGLCNERFGRAAGHVRARGSGACKPYYKERRCSVCRAWSLEDERHVCWGAPGSFGDADAHRVAAIADEELQAWAAFMADVKKNARPTR